MKQIFGSLLEVRKGEVVLTGLMFSYYYLALVTHYFLKPARDNLFLVRLGVSELPVVFILIALIVVPVTMLYSRSAGSFELNQLMSATGAIVVVQLLVLRWLVELDDSWVCTTSFISG